MRRQVNGILLLDKPAGLTSNGALQRVKRLFNAKKAGHTGSLDPIATGMLPLCFGEATKFSQFLLDSDKTYEVVARLGAETTTGDTEGEISIEHDVPADLTLQQVDAAAAAFRGEISQIPPMHSAIKVQGKPLYELARKGIEIERKARTVTIFRLEILDLQGRDLSLRVHCSKGTYIRTLVQDLGRVLGCGAYVTALRRTSVSPYQQQNMVTLEALEALVAQSGFVGLEACLLPVETAVQVFPAVQLSSAATFYLKTGQAVRAPFPLTTPMVRLMSDDAKFLGIGEVMTDGRVKPHRLVQL